MKRSFPLLTSYENDNMVTLFTVQNNTGYILRIMSNENLDDGIDLLQGITKNYVVESHEDEYAKTFE